MASIQSSTDPRIAQPAMSLRDRLAGYLQNATSYLPASMQSYPDIPQMGVKQGTLAKDLMTPVENAPVVGQALAAEDVGAARQRGDWLSMGAAALGLMPGGGAEKHAAKEAVEAGRDTLARIRAYHGSPHDFDKFDLSKIGTGEGAQAYGHGLYFAENEGVAKGYRDKLATGNVDDVKPDDEAIAAIKPQWDKITADLRAEFAQSGQRPTPRSAELQNQLDALNANAVDDTLARKPWLTKGALYEVDINADPEHFLDWDKPWDQQSAHVKEILPQLGYSTAPMATGPQAQNLSGAAREFAKPEEVEALKKAGIPGIKYLDQGSRDPAKMKELADDLAQYREAAKHWAATGDDAKLATANKQIEVLEKRLNSTRNYVVFDDKLISIVKKYGIAAAIGGGLITAQQAQQMQEQGLIEG